MGTTTTDGWKLIRVRAHIPERVTQKYVVKRDERRKKWGPKSKEITQKLQFVCMIGVRFKKKLKWYNNLYLLAPEKYFDACCC